MNLGVWELKSQVVLTAESLPLLKGLLPPGTCAGSQKEGDHCAPVALKKADTISHSFHEKGEIS